MTGKRGHQLAQLHRATLATIGDRGHCIGVRPTRVGGRALAQHQPEQAVEVGRRDLRALPTELELHRQRGVHAQLAARRPRAGQRHRLHPRREGHLVPRGLAPSASTTSIGPPRSATHTRASAATSRRPRPSATTRATPARLSAVISAATCRGPCRWR